jgi:hypothetical protein
MFFIIKKSVNQVDFFVPDQYAFAVEYAPVEKASKFIPKWYKECPSSQGKQRTVKGCVGLIDLLTSGFIIPAWSEFKINWNNKELVWENSDSMSILTENKNEEIPGFCNNYYKVKITSPWLAFFKKQTRVMWVPPVLHTGFDVPYKMVPGCQTSVSRHNVMLTNNFLFLEKKETKQSIFIEHRQPLTHLIPLDDYDYKINCHVDTDKWHKFGSILNDISFAKKGIKQLMLDKLRIREGAK